MATCCDWTNLVVSAIGSLFGYSAFIVFFCVFGNSSAGFWGLTSGILATITFYLHLIYIKERIYVWYSNRVIGDFQVLGFIGLTSGLAASVFYIFLQCYWKTPILPVQTSVVVSIVWSLLTAKWGYLLFRSAGKYSRSNGLLLSDGLMQSINT